MQFNHSLSLNGFSLYVLISFWLRYATWTKLLRGFDAEMIFC